MTFEPQKSPENKGNRNVNDHDSRISRVQKQTITNNRGESDQNGLLQRIAQNNDKISETYQLKAHSQRGHNTDVAQRKENETGLPDDLKSGMENLSGMSLDDVKVHTNSSNPAQFHAHAYAQGTDIHLGPGQEKHLPHELGHVVQQKQGRVQPTKQLAGKVNINDDAALEKEADTLGERALGSQTENSSLEIKPQFDSVLQRAEKKALITQKTKLKQDLNGSPMPDKKMFGSSTIGEYLQVGTFHNNVDFAVTKVASGTTYYKTHIADGPDTAWLNAERTIPKSVMGGGPPDPDFDPENMGADALDSISGAIDNAAEGIESTWLKGVAEKKSSWGIVDGNATVKEKADGTKEDRTNGAWGDFNKPNAGLALAKDSLDVASGTIGVMSNIWKMGAAAKDFSQSPSIDKFAEGGEQFIAGLANTSKLIDASAKAGGMGGGIGVSDAFGKVTGGIDSGVASVKSAFLGIAGLFKLYNSPSNDQKGKDALVSFKHITESALSAAKVAKTVYDIIGKGIPPALITTIPAISLAVSAISCIIRISDALQAANSKEEMKTKSLLLRDALASEFGASSADLEKLFRKEKRGIAPKYHNYYRVDPKFKLGKTLPDAFEAGNNADSLTEEKNNEIIHAAGHDNLRFKSKRNRSVLDPKAQFDKSVLREQVKEIAAGKAKTRADAAAKKCHDFLIENDGGLNTPEYIRLYDQWEIQVKWQNRFESQQRFAANAKTPYNDLVKHEVHRKVDDSGTSEHLKAKIKEKVSGHSDLKKLNDLSDKIREYELVDKMSEINDKRRTAGYSGVAKEMISMTADVLTLSGVGAIVGLAMKGAVAAGGVAYAGGKALKNWNRNKDAGTGDGISKSGGVDKSQKQKHKEYVNHTRQIFKMLSSAESPEQGENVLQIIKATGVDTSELFAQNGKPDKQMIMMVEAMKKRG